jgi:hypothetical protein
MAIWQDHVWRTPHRAGQPLILSAVNTARGRGTSVHPDNETNPNRNSLFILQRTINARLRVNEFSIQNQLFSLLGGQQFFSSHGFQNINVNQLRAYILSLNNVDDSMQPPQPLPESHVVQRPPDNDDDDAQESHVVQRPPDDDNDDNDDDDENDDAQNVDLVRQAGRHEPNVAQDIVVDGHNVVFVHAHTDYLFRPESLSTLSFFEFMMTINKERIPPSAADRGSGSRRGSVGGVGGTAGGLVLGLAITIT